MGLVASSSCSPQQIPPSKECVSLPATSIFGARFLVTYTYHKSVIFFSLAAMYGQGIGAHCNICKHMNPSNFQVAVLRQGYKLLFYAYYSHSMQHESEFRESKLGA